MCADAFMLWTEKYRPKSLDEVIDQRFVVDRVKIIILDEADNMTSDAQQALRRTMELYTRTCRFILIANYSSKIIDPIQSRCAVFRFQPLKSEDIVARLKFIAEMEKLELKEDGLEAILYVAQGDLRRAINTLQAAAALGAVDENSVYRVVGKVNPVEIREMMNFALRGDFLKARSKLRELMVIYGLSGVDVIRQLHGEVFALNLPERFKVKLADKIGEINFRLVEGADEEIQLSSLLAFFALCGEELR